MARILARISETASVVAVQIGNQPSWPAVLLALFRRNLIPLPLGRHVESAELDAALRTCGVSALLTSVGGASLCHSD